MSVLHGKKILLAVSGGIAAYKTAFLVRLFIKNGAEVKVILTDKAKEFVTPLTLATLSKNPVFTELNDENGNWANHVELGIWADYMMVAPATANTLAKMAQGITDNLLLTTFLSARCPIIVAPAMDLDMYKHHTTQENLNLLKEKNILIIPPNAGELASGLIGEGRMAEPEEIIRFLENYIKKSLTLSHKKVLITAGPTYEPIDPVRFIGNHSSGKMGFALAKEASKRGAEVVLISGPTHQSIENYNIKLIKVNTAQEMYQAAIQHFDATNIAILSAAVADYKPKKYSAQKIKKSNDDLVIELEKNPDIFFTLGTKKTHQTLIGFALETENEEQNAWQKLHKKNADAIVLNSLQDQGAGFTNDTNKIKILTKQGTIREFPLKSKAQVAQDILDFIEDL